MGNNAESDQTQLAIYEESAWGETPSSPAMEEIPFSGESLAHIKQTTNTDTIRKDAQVNANLELGASGGGAINYELIFGDYDKLIEGALRSSFVTASVTAASVSFDAATQQIRDSGDGFTELAGFTRNMWVNVKDAYNAENNGLFRVTGRADGALTVANGASSLVDEAAGTPFTVAGKYIRNGVEKHSYLIQKGFTDITKYIYYPGCVVGGMTLNLNALGILNGVFQIQGKQGVPIDSSIAGSIADASTNEQVTASANVGTILMDNAVIGIPLKGIVSTIDNGLRERPQLGSKYSNGIGRGKFTQSGSVEAYFEDHTLYNKLVDHTPVILTWRVTDIDGNAFVFTIPKVYFNAGSPDASGGEDDVVLPMDFDAPVNKDTGYDYTLQIDAIEV